MAKTKISEWSSTSADNTDISNINIAEGCSPANVNNAIRTVMAQVKDLQAGLSGDTIPVAAGGTGSTTATAARTALSAAKSGANSDITSITGLTTALSTLQGGTGAIQRAISNVARTSNVVTVTTSVAHGFSTGDYVTIAAVTNTSINGTFLITGVSTNTFTYSQTGSNIASVADTGTALDISYCNLTNNVTNILPIGNGGTGSSTLKANNLLVGNGTSAVSVIPAGTTGNVLTSSTTSTVTAGSFVVGTEYTILTVGTTNFTLIGAASNTVGVVFTATGVGTGTGTATTNTWVSSAPFSWNVSNVSSTSTISSGTTSYSITSNTIMVLGTAYHPMGSNSGTALGVRIKNSSGTTLFTYTLTGGNENNGGDAGSGLSSRGAWSVAIPSAAIGGTLEFYRASGSSSLTLTINQVVKSA